MSRTSLRDRRLRFFERGNTHCPICLTPFTEAGVRAGRVVTLEHVPQKSVGGRPACLTCVRCNTGTLTGKMDLAVANYYQAQDDGGYPMTVEEDGERTRINPKHVQINHEAGRVKISAELHKVPANIRRWLTDTPQRVRLTWTHPTEYAIGMGLLKSAYLMVFCLLGEAGYRYAQGEAVSSIREQLLSPEKELIRPLVSSATTTHPHFPEHTVALTEEQCWLAKIGTNWIILPPGGSIDRYRMLEEAFRAAPLSLGSQVWWPTLKFGDASPIYGKKSDALKTKHFFGKPLRFRSHPHRHYVVVYDDSDMVAVLPVSGPPRSES